MMSCQIGHVRHPVPYGLRRMDIPGYHQMVGEYRIRIYQNVIFALFSPFKFQMMLLRRPVLCTQEAFSRLE